MSEMTSKQRMKTALSGGIPDRVPAAPDISCLIPCRFSGRDYWDVLYYANPPLWKAYIDAINHFGIDGWFIYGGVQFTYANRPEIKVHIDRTAHEMTVTEVIDTPDGELRRRTLFHQNDSSAPTEKLIKNFKEDFPKLRHLYSDITGYDKSELETMKKVLGERGMDGTYVIPPGLHIFSDYFEGNMEAATYAYYDYPELFEELTELHTRRCMQELAICLESGFDSILTGGSGSITMQSPDIWREMSLPVIKEITKQCREAGVICGIHSCGKEAYIVKTCAEETALDYINPLEIPPMGDCTLREMKQLYGNKLALMGNLHTTDLMLFGSKERVTLESLKAIRDAGENGGFVLSTGDQCGRDTPYENIFALVETARTFGTYPLNMERIDAEIARLEKIVLQI